MKGLDYYTGLILISLSVIVSIFSVYFVIFALPFFLIGLFLVLVSKRSWKAKILAIFNPLLIGILCILLILNFYRKGTPETYLIPEDFEGRFRVIFGEACGIQPMEHEGRRILEIPRDGVLIIQPEFETGTIDHEYYLVDDEGNRTRINMLLDAEDFKIKGSGVLMDFVGKTAGPMPNGSLSSESPLAIEFLDFYVAKNDSSWVENYFEKIRFDSLARESVNRCRKKFEGKAL